MQAYYIIDDKLNITYVGFFKTKEDARNRYNDKYHNHSKDLVKMVLTEKEIGKLQEQFSKNLYSMLT